MRILVFSLFLCLNFFTSHAQSNSKTSDATLLVNGTACDKCTLELTGEELRTMNLSTNQDSVKVVGFKLKIPGSPTISVRGHKFNQRSLIALSRSSIGRNIQVFGVKTNKGSLKTYIIVKHKR